MKKVPYNLKKDKKVIAFDLDDVLCYRESEEGKIDKYKSCKPINQMIEIVNKCYDQGNKIIIYTARGMTTQKGNINMVYSKLYEMTKKQLNEWGIKYHELVMGKIHYDLLIDDKAINSTTVGNIKIIDNFFGEKK